MASPHIEVDSPVQALDCSKAWSALDQKEQLYAYYFFKASWEGSKTCYFQRSYESPALFLIFQEFFAVPKIEDKVQAAGLDALEWAQFKAFAMGVYTNTGNYRGFGDTKILPELARARFEVALSAAHSERLSQIWGRIAEKVYENNENVWQLGFPDKGGVTSYYSPDITSAEAEVIKEFLASQGLTDMHINSRLWKVGGVYEIRVASMKGHPQYGGTYEYKGKTIKILNGDFAVFMERVTENLAQALPYVANAHQEAMLCAYIKHFATGDIEFHKESQRAWIQDKGPVVETNIGFIETYVDPLNIRAEFEGFTSIVDKEVSQQFAQLVDRAPEIIPLLPWGPAYEKDAFQAPDFTSLVVIAFANSGTPIGINLPNYDEIRMFDGFKNVNLGNAYPKVTPTTLQFLSAADVELITSMYGSAETVAVALHELLGHGSGKLLKAQESGGFNFSEDTTIPWTGTKVHCWYQHDETWNSKFGEYSSAYEECRAETVALYLSTYDVPFTVFGVQDTERAMQMVWLYMAYSGVKGLLLYNVEKNKWGQAHCWARYVIFRVLLECGVASVDFAEDTFTLRLDYSQIKTSGFAAVSSFLTKLHVYKSIGDFEGGKALFDQYSVMDETALKLREIVVKAQKPRRCNVQCNLFLTGTGVALKEYAESADGVIESFLERYPEYDEEMLALWESEYSTLSNCAPA